MAKTFLIYETVKKNSIREPCVFLATFEKATDLAVALKRIAKKFYGKTLTVQIVDSAVRGFSKIDMDHERVFITFYCDGENLLEDSDLDFDDYEWSSAAGKFENANESKLKNYQGQVCVWTCDPKSRIFNIQDLAVKLFA